MGMHGPSSLHAFYLYIRVCICILFPPTSQPDASIGEDGRQKTEEGDAAKPSVCAAASRRIGRREHARRTRWTRACHRAPSMVATVSTATSAMDALPESWALAQARNVISLGSCPLGATCAEERGGGSLGAHASVTARRQPSRIGLASPAPAPSRLRTCPGPLAGPMQSSRADIHRARLTSFPCPYGGTHIAARRGGEE